MNSKNLNEYKDVVVAYFRKLIFFDKSLIDKILNVMFVDSPELSEKVIVDSDEMITLNRLINFLSEYDGANVEEDFNMYLMNLDHKYVSYFYIYFLQLFTQYNFDNLMFNAKYRINMRELFYTSEAEAFFNHKKFRLHFRNASLGGMKIDEEIDSSITDYIASNLDKNYDNDLEKAIAIYYLLCKKFVYDPEYVVYRDLDYTLDYDKVSIDNNRVVCVQFAIIYYKLLQKYGIDSCLVGDINSHMFVNLRIGTMMITADGSRYGNFTEDYNISDITGVKYDFLLDGMFINGTFYSDQNYLNYNRDKLDKAIKNVYKKMGLRVGLRNKFKTLITKFQGKKLFNSEVNKEDIDRRVNFLNSVYYPVDSEVEKMQMLTKLVVDIFNDIEDERTEQITLYKYVDGKTLLNRLLVVYDIEMQPYYYFLEDGKYVNYVVDTIVEKILNDGWLFKNQIDIEALCLEDEERILKLMR